MNIKNISTEDLIKELEERKNKKPQKLGVIDWTKLINLAESYISDVETGDTREDDEHWFYEEVLQTIYGKDIWEWINSFN